MSNTIPTAARARRSIPAPLPAGISTSPASSTATTTNASAIGRTSVFQCGCKISTDSSPTARDRSYATPDILGLLKHCPRDVTALAAAAAAWLELGHHFRENASGWKIASSPAHKSLFGAQVDTKIRSSPTATVGAREAEFSSR